MILVCIRPFGTHVPGDEVPVPDDTEDWDHWYFEAKEEQSPEVKGKK